MDESKRIVRDLNRLDLARMRGGMRQGEYERRRSVLMRQQAELSGETKAEKETKVSIQIRDIEDAWREITAAMSNFKVSDREGAWLGSWAGVDYARTARTDGMVTYREITTPAPAPTMIWDEFGGAIVCECDNADCFERITITRDEYFRASGNGGYARLTSPACAYGILGARLLERGAHWHVWSK